jgi:hypothetical protein
VRQGAYHAYLSLYEIDVILEEYRRVCVVGLGWRERCGRWVYEGGHGRGENKVKVILGL